MKKNALFFLLISFYIGACKLITVSYDDQDDYIVYNDKIYFPQKITLRLENAKDIVTNSSDIPAVGDLSGGQWWTFLCISSCKNSN